MDQQFKKAQLALTRRVEAIRQFMEKLYQTVKEALNNGGAGVLTLAGSLVAEVIQMFKKAQLGVVSRKLNKMITDGPIQPAAGGSGMGKGAPKPAAA